MANDTLSLDGGRGKPFYCYMYYDPRHGKNMEPIYAGKGSKKRAQEHWSRPPKHNPLFRGVLAQIKAAGLKPVIERVLWFDVETAALLAEKDLIALIGRRHLGTGPLCNLTEGGDGFGTENWTNASPEKRSRMLTRTTLWQTDPEHAAASRAAMQAARDRQTSEERVAHNLAVQVAKKALGHITSAQVKYYYETATDEDLAAHALAISNAKAASSEQIGKTSSEVWAREGMKEFISRRIGEGQSEAWHDESRGEQRRETASINHQKQFFNPVTRETHSKGCSSRMRADWADPVKREAMLEARRVKKDARLAAEAGETLS